MLLHLLHELSVSGQHKVDGCTLAAETTSTTDSVDVVFALLRQLVVDHETHLLHVDTTRKQVGGDEHAHCTGTELAHDYFTLELLHFAMHD